VVQGDQAAGHGVQRQQEHQPHRALQGDVDGDGEVAVEAEDQLAQSVHVGVRQDAVQDHRGDGSADRADRPGRPGQQQRRRDRDEHEVHEGPQALEPGLRVRERREHAPHPSGVLARSASRGPGERPTQQETLHAALGVREAPRDHHGGDQDRQTDPDDHRPRAQGEQRDRQPEGERTQDQ
jgi:hypothetical protein